MLSRGAPVPTRSPFRWAERLRGRLRSNERSLFTVHLAAAPTPSEIRALLIWGCILHSFFGFRDVVRLFLDGYERARDFQERNGDVAVISVLSI